MKFAALIATAVVLVGSAIAADWTPTTWSGERAFASDEGKLRAIVSVERGRLVYFGGADGGSNLLFAPTARGGRVGWGGHRVWLGPQSEWGWPPPAAWEASAAESATTRDGKLELTMPDAGQGWPRLTRVYFWSEGALHCDVRLSGGSRSAQIIQIFQTPPATVPALRAEPAPGAPRGYVQVHMGRQPSPRYEFETPPHVAVVDDLVRLKFLDRTEKLGFKPQPIAAKLGDVHWVVARGVSTGAELSVPDDGYATQVYLGSGESQLIELEQLSPLWAAGTDARFEVILSVDARASTVP